MKTTKQLKFSQKLAALFIIIAGIITIGRILNLINNENKLIEDITAFISLIGFTFYLYPIFFEKFKNHKLNKNLLIALIFFSTLQLNAQDYSKQIEAFTKSFADKNTKALQPYMSTELKFGQIPAASTPAIMSNIVTNLPKLNSMSIVESVQGKAKVKYDFVGLGIRESHLFFDTEGKITKIELVENLIKQEAEARRQQQQSVQLPNPGGLGNKYTPKKVEFNAPDGLTINGNLYEIDKSKLIILLTHQAGYNRIEYADIAPKLNELGYNCLAIDLRSGGNFGGKPNNTNQRAIEKKLKPEMIDAQQDIAAAIDYLNKKYNQKIILWGSSFSSSLALLEGANNHKVKAIIGFSPGNYFGNAAPSLATVFSKIEKPFLVTSSKQEATTLSALIGKSELKTNQQQFIPTSTGFHGSRALWTGQKGAEEYWEAVTQFLSQLK